MPRDGSGTYAPPPGTLAAPDTLIESAKHNAWVQDLTQDANTARPISAGGTGGTSPETARTALGLKPLYDAFSGATATVGASFAFAEGTDNGTNKVTMKGPDSVSADRTILLPDASGTVALLGTVAGKLDTRRNRIVNHDMRMDQEWNGAAGTTNGRFGRDQFATYFNSSAATITTQGVSSVTPAGSPNRYRVTITTADTSLAAGEYLTISQNLEGSNVADFMYGGANAKQSVLRFGFKAPAGTYAVHLGNSAANRSYVALFTISAGQANTDTVQTVVIPGDTTGTWLTADGVIGITLDIVLAAGSTFQGAAGWQAGNILATSAISNGMGTGSAVFELFDVGLRLDPDATGVYGQYEVGEVDPVYRSERYWEKSYDDTVAVNTVNQSGMVTGVAAGSGLFWGFAPFKVKKCKARNPDIYNPFAVNAGTIRNATSGTDISTSGQYPGQNSFVIIASTTGGSLMAFHWVVNARLT